jgi:hypothetical protein
MSFLIEIKIKEYKKYIAKIRINVTIKKIFQETNSSLKTEKYNKTEEYYNTKFVHNTELMIINL